MQAHVPYWHGMPDGVVLVRPKTKSIKDLAGLPRQARRASLSTSTTSTVGEMAGDANCATLENSRQLEELQNDKKREQTDCAVPKLLPASAFKLA